MDLSTDSTIDASTDCFKTLNYQILSLYHIFNSQMSELNESEQMSLLRSYAETLER